MIHRIVQPEILDTLLPDDPAALRNRKDLAFINFMMGNYRWLRGALDTYSIPQDSILELGSGLGELGLTLPQKLKDKNIKQYAGLDLWPRPQGWPEQWAWHCADLLKFEHYADYSVVIGNLILHQFEDEALKTLFENIKEHVRLLIFCETSRQQLHLWQLPLLRLVGANYVSMHDGKVSIRAGFRGNELAELMCLDSDQWEVNITTTFLGAYRLIAVRKATH